MSYDATSQLMSKKKGRDEIILVAGSYNPGNQPEYGNDWEYYDVEHIIWLDSGEGETIKGKQFDNESQAIAYFNSMVKSVLKIYKPSETTTEKELKKAYDLGEIAYKNNIESPSRDFKVTKMMKSKTSLSAEGKIATSWWKGWKHSKETKDPLIASIKSTISKPSSPRKEKEYLMYSGTKKFGIVKAFTLSDAKARAESSFGKGLTIREKPSAQKDASDKIYKHLTRTMEIYPRISKPELKKISGESRYHVDKFWKEYRK